MNLINQLLDLSKLDEHKLELHATQSNLVIFARQLTLSFHSLAEQKGIALDYVAPQEEIFVYFDDQKMEQILLNLISNAIKFNREGGKVVVELHKDDSFVEIVVKDTGIGISPEQQPHVFDRFFQADHEDTSFSSGTGIGLALTKQLVELHGGSIELSSAKDQGSKFLVRLPLGKQHLKADQIWNVGIIKKPQGLKEDLPTFLDEIVVSSEADSKNKPILLDAEDNLELRRYVSQQFLDDFQVVEALDGADAWEKSLAQTPDLIISDVMMPKMNGYELCEKIKSDIRTNHIPFILLTAKIGEEDKLHGFEKRADDYLTKPFNIRALKVRVQNLIALRQTYQDHFQQDFRLAPKAIQGNSMEQEFLNQLTELLENNLDDVHFGVEQLSDALAMSRSQMYRKLKALTGMTPTVFLRRFRLERAQELLIKGMGNVTEIAYEVGFSSPAYFTKCFSEQFGYLPKDVKKQA